jgi:hypothetical protein
MATLGGCGVQLAGADVDLQDGDSFSDAGHQGRRGGGAEQPAMHQEDGIRNLMQWWMWPQLIRLRQCRQSSARKRSLLVSLDENQTLMSQQADDSILF